MRRDTRSRKNALAGLWAISGQGEMWGALVRVISSGKQALDAVMLEMGRMVAGEVLDLELELKLKKSCQASGTSPTRNE